MPKITYTFVASQANSVVRAFNSISAAADRAAAKSTQATRAVAAAQGRVPATIRAAEVSAEQVNRRVRSSRTTSTAVAADMQERSRRERQIRLQKEEVKQREANEKAMHKEAVARDRANRAAERIEAAERRKAGRGAARAGGAGGRVGRAITAGAAVMGAYAVASGIGSAVKESVGLQDLAGRIAIKSPGGGDAGEIAKGLRRSALAAPGVSAMDVGRGVETFIGQTGQAELAHDLKATFAEFSLAAQTDIGEMARAAATLYQSFDVRTVEEMRAALAAWIVQGKEAAFEMEDWATYAPKVVAAAGAFGIEKGVAGTRTLGALAQIARPGTGGGAQTATGMETFLRELQKDYKLFNEKLGVEIYTPGGTPKGLVDTILSIVEASAGDVRKTSFLEQRSGRMLNPFFGKYQEYLRQTGSPILALAALKKEIDDLRDVKDAEKTVGEDFVKATQLNSSRMTAAWENVLAMVDSTVIPGVVKFVDALPALVAAVSPLIDILGLFAQALSGVLGIIGLVAGKTTEEKLHKNKYESFVAGEELKKLEGIEKERPLTEYEQIQKRLASAKVGSLDDERKELEATRLKELQKLEKVSPEAAERAKAERETFSMIPFFGPRGTEEEQAIRAERKLREEKMMRMTVERSAAHAASMSGEKGFMPTRFPGQEDPQALVGGGIDAAAKAAMQINGEIDTAAKRAASIAAAFENVKIPEWGMTITPP